MTRLKDLNAIACFAFPARAVAASCMPLLLLATASAGAQSWPSKPIRFIVTLAPGSAVDIVARVTGEPMSRALGQPVVVESRPGAGGVVAAEFVMRSPADGYTMLVGSIASHGINPSLVSKIPYDALKDFAPVVSLASSPNVLIASNSLPVKSVKELIALAKARPDALSYASTGNGAPTHLAGELFKTMAGVKMLHVPYKGAAPAVVDLLSGHVQLSFISAPGVMPHVEAGRLRVLAVTNARRSVLLPQVPTISEAGLQGYESEGWHGLFTPAGTVKVIANPVRLSETPADYRLAPPALGADTDAVLRDIAGMTDAEITKLREKALV